MKRDNPASPQTASRRRKTCLRVLFGIFAGIAILAGGLYLSSVLRQRATVRYWRELGEEARRAADWSGEGILPEYRSLYERNGDLVGWLRMEDASLDFPVMQTKDDPEYYLRRTFEGENDWNGTPFADFRCAVTPVQGFNTILYAHDGVLWPLFEYAFNPNFYPQCRYLRFDTLTERGVYEVCAAFFADATGAVLLNPWDSAHEQAYTFYNYLTVDSPEGFRRYVDTIARLNTLTEEQPPDLTMDRPILTLIACGPPRYSGIMENGRFVVIAQRIEESAVQAVDTAAQLS